MKLALVGLGYWGGKVLRNMVAMLGAENVVAVDESDSLVDWARVSYPGLICRSSLPAALDEPRHRRSRDRHAGRQPRPAHHDGVALRPGGARREAARWRARPRHGSWPSSPTTSVSS